MKKNKNESDIEKQFIEKFGALPTDTQYLQLLELLIVSDGIEIRKDIGVTGNSIREAILAAVLAIHKEWYDTDLDPIDDVIKILKLNNT